jgi:hypothetical protein
MPGTASFEPAPTPPTPFPALRLKTPLPTAQRDGGVADQLDRMLETASRVERRDGQISALVDRCLATLDQIDDREAPAAPRPA